MNTPFNATLLQKPVEATHAITHANIETLKKITEANMQALHASTQALHASTKAYFDGMTTLCNLNQKLSEDNLQQAAKTGNTTGK